MALKVKKKNVRLYKRKINLSKLEIHGLPCRVKQTDATVSWCPGSKYIHLKGGPGDLTGTLDGSSDQVINFSHQSRYFSLVKREKCVKRVFASLLILRYICFQLTCYGPSPTHPNHPVPPLPTHTQQSIHEALHC